jgi:hypothetical protein
MSTRSGRPGIAVGGAAAAVYLSHSRAHWPSMDTGHTTSVAGTMGMPILSPLPPTAELPVGAEPSAAAAAAAAVASACATTSATSSAVLPCNGRVGKKLSACGRGAYSRHRVASSLLPSINPSFASRTAPGSEQCAQSSASAPRSAHNALRTLTSPISSAPQCIRHHSPAPSRPPHSVSATTHQPHLVRPTVHPSPLTSPISSAPQCIRHHSPAPSRPQGCRRACGRRPRMAARAAACACRGSETPACHP